MILFQFNNVKKTFVFIVKEIAYPKGI